MGKDRIPRREIAQDVYWCKAPKVSQSGPKSIRMLATLISFLLSHICAVIY